MNESPQDFEKYVNIPKPDPIVEPVEVTTPDEQELTYRELYERILADDDIIITIDAIAEPTVRKGLVSYKSKLNAKLRDNDMPVPDESLDFQTIETLPGGKIRYKIWIKRKPTVKIYGYQVADGEI